VIVSRPTDLNETALMARLITSFFFCSFGLLAADANLIADPDSVFLLKNEILPVNFNFTEPLSQWVLVNLTTQHGEVVGLTKNLLNTTGSGFSINISGKSPGHDIISANLIPPITDTSKAFIHVTVGLSKTWDLISTIIGWVYFLAWSVSFYPQVYENWKRKSVVGLNFDFLMLNLIGFVLYSIFNCGLYWIPEIEAEYFHRHPKGLNPVQLNDIVFSLHASIVTVFTICQCLCYERGGQTVSKTALFIVSIFFIIVIVSMGLSIGNKLSWLDFLYISSYIKLTITLIKYIPQAIMNYKRKSTIGWSIGNVLLDFTGGTLSVLQMLINAANYNDWASIFGDPTKFGLGLFSVLFDIFFLIQHYVLYRSGYDLTPREDVQTIVHIEDDLRKVYLNDITVSKGKF